MVGLFHIIWGNGNPYEKLFFTGRVNSAGKEKCECFQHCCSIHFSFSWSILHLNQPSNVGSPSCHSIWHILLGQSRYYDQYRHNLWFTFPYVYMIIHALFFLHLFAPLYLSHIATQYITFSLIFRCEVRSKAIMISGAKTWLNVWQKSLSEIISKPNYSSETCSLASLIKITLWWVTLWSDVPLTDRMTQVSWIATVSSMVLPWSFTRNLNTMVSKRNLLFQGFIFRFHVTLQGCKHLWLPILQIRYSYPCHDESVDQWAGLFFPPRSCNGSWEYKMI